MKHLSALLEELDYRELYSAYSGMIRKSQVEPRILFEILVLAYMQGVYSSRKIEQLCRNHIQFISTILTCESACYSVDKGAAAGFAAATASSFTSKCEFNFPFSLDFSFTMVYYVC